MKKAIAFSFVAGLLLILSLGFVLSAQDNDRGVPRVLNSIKQVLTDILEQLEIIAEQETNIEVVVEPEVIVEPNITIPEQECDWEYFNEEVTPVRIGTTNMYKLVLLTGIPFSEYEIIEIDMALNFPGGQGGVLLVNDPNNACWGINSHGGDFSDCIDDFHAGVNDAEINHFSNHQWYKAFFEYRIKPVNC